MSIEHPRCICGKKCKRKTNGQMGKTCGNRSCSGLMSKKHMQEVLKCNSTFHIPRREFYVDRDYWEDR